MFTRILQEVIQKDFFSGKAVILLGPRQAGKTTLLRQLSKQVESPQIWLNGDSSFDRALLNNLTGKRAKELFPKGAVVYIDEAQRLDNTGLSLKIIHDNCEGIQMIATGSSSFELTDKIKEALTGRKWTYRMFPLSQEELIQHFGMLDTIRMLDTRLVFGSYPEVINNAGQEIETLQELVSDYLYKDVFALKDVRKPDGLEKLVQALAFQVGNQVSYRELSNLTGLNKSTVEKYIRLLEDAYIIFRLPTFSRNLRVELAKSRKIYFVDNGIRNAVISGFNPLGVRNDIGALWENFLMSERRKYIKYHRLYRNVYFWRTTQQQEIDYIEEYDGKIIAYEFKWNPKRKVKFPRTFLKAYPDAETKSVNRDNYTDFVFPGL
ncbi:MAG TPA: ATP-binding protein [Bacteroidetes bacterium]|nr:ATP-binding protein [Bacteroidota bacterium]